MKRVMLIALWLALSVGGCKPATIDPDIIENAILETQSAKATISLTPTMIPTTTQTPSPTSSNTPTTTKTATLTITPSPSSTSTLEARTATAYYVNAAKTTRAAAVTNTVAAQKATSTEIARYKFVGWRGLDEFASTYNGQRVAIRGYIENILSKYEMSVTIGFNYEYIYVKTRQPIKDIYIGQSAMFYGKVDDNFCIQTIEPTSTCKPIGQNRCMTVEIVIEECHPALVDAFYIYK